MTRVSMRTRPKITRRRITGPDAGFLEMPSQALLIDLAWQIAPTEAVRVMIAPPTIRDHMKRFARLSVRGACWAPPVA